MTWFEMLNLRKDGTIWGSLPGSPALGAGALLDLLVDSWQVALEIFAGEEIEGSLKILGLDTLCICM